MSRPPRLPKLAIPSSTLSPHAARQNGDSKEGEEKQPLTAVERGRGMVVPPTPVVVPPTPVGGHGKEETGGRQRRPGVGDVQVKGVKTGPTGVNGKKVEPSTSSTGKDSQDEAENGADDIIIVQSPEDEEPSIPIHSWNDTRKPSRDMDKTPQPRSPNPMNSNGRNAEGRKSPIPTGRSRSRSSSSSSQCTSCF
jgi:hypothetical protein